LGSFLLARPGAKLVMLLIPYFVRDPLLLSVVGAAVCALVWGGVKAGL
jgi:hypothetical protein